MKIRKHLYDLPDEFCEGIITLAIDTETMGLNLKRDRLCVVQLLINEKEIHVIHFPKPRYDSPNLKRILGDKDIFKLFHFARFDMSSIYINLGILVTNVACTRILSKVTRTYSDKHGLKELCRELLKKDLNKSEQSSDWGNEELNQAQINYAASDVQYLHEIFNILKDIAVRENRYQIADLTFSLLPSVVLLDRTEFDFSELINF